MKIGIIGGGTMGEAIIASVLKAGLTSASEIQVADLYQPRLKQLHDTYGAGIAESNSDAAAGAGLLVLAVKPQDFPKAAQDTQAVTAETTVVSIMAGVPIGKIAAALKTERVVRAMPNTPATIGEGMTVWTATPSVTDAGREGARAVFQALGREAYVPEERYLDMATALSGSGPAYVFLFIEALIDAGVHIGLSRDLATTMALQTVLGSTRYAEETKKHPGELRAQVTSPGGTTAEALRAFEAGGFRAAVLEAVIAAYDKSRALGEGASK
jgi:pyrroline-5-carboxylate reductase